MVRWVLLRLCGDERAAEQHPASRLAGAAAGDPECQPQPLWAPAICHRLTGLPAAGKTRPVFSRGDFSSSAKFEAVLENMPLRGLKNHEATLVHQQTKTVRT